jgi:hypothetical protein
MTPEMQAKITAMYDAVHDHNKEDIESSLTWAKNILTAHEGTGHLFHVIPTRDGMVCCSFAKPEWGGDHCGDPMESGSEAIVRAVCEYLCGA